MLLKPDPREIMCKNPEIERIINEGLIKLPEANSLEKVSSWGTIVAMGPKCYSGLREGNRVRISKNLESASPYWYIENGVKYRWVKESDLDVYET